MYCLLLPDESSENKKQTKKIFLPSTFFCLPSPTSKQHRGTQRNGGCDQSLTLCCFFMLLFHVESPHPVKCHPSQTDPVWPSHRLHLSKHFPNMALYHRANPSGRAPYGSPWVAAPPDLLPPLWALLHGLQLLPVLPLGCSSSRPHPLLYRGLLHGLQTMTNNQMSTF